MIDKILKELSIPEIASRIYLKLAEAGYLSARQLAENLGLPRATIYDNLGILIKNSLVVEKEQNGKKMFNIDEPNEFERLLDDKIDNLNKAKKKIKDWRSNLKTSTLSNKPIFASDNSRSSPGRLPSFPLNPGSVYALMMVQPWSLQYPVSWAS